MDSLHKGARNVERCLCHDGAGDKLVLIWGHIVKSLLSTSGTGSDDNVVKTTTLSFYCQVTWQ